MRRHALVFALALALATAVFGGCPAPTPPVPPSPDASDAAPPVDLFVAVCAHLSHDGGLGCPEGDAPTCAAVMQSAHGKATDLHPKCLLDAVSKEAARACQSIDCVDPSSPVPPAASSAATAASSAPAPASAPSSLKPPPKHR